MALENIGLKSKIQFVGIMALVLIVPALISYNFVSAESGLPITPPITSPVTPPISPSPTAIPTSTPTATPSATPKPTMSPTPNPTVIPTPTPKPVCYTTSRKITECKQASNCGGGIQGGPCGGKDIYGRQKRLCTRTVTTTICNL